MKQIKQKTHDLLRSTEKYTKTDMVYLARGGFWLTMIQIVTVASSFLLSIIFARLFPKDAYGMYRYVIALAGITGTLSLTGLGGAVAQSVARGFDGSLRLGYKENLKWSAGVVLTSLIGALYYYTNHNYDLAISFIIIGILSPFLNGFSLYNSYLTGKKNFEALGILSLIRNGLPTIILIASIFFTKNAVVLVGLYFIAHTISAGLCYLVTLFISTPSEEKDQEMMGYAKHLSLMSVLNTIADQIDKVIVFHYVGAVELAIYSFATALPTQVKSVLKGIYSLALPKFSNKPLHELQKNMGKQMLQLFIATIVSVTLYIIAAPYLFQLFFPKYMEAVAYSQIFAFSLISIVSTIPSTVLQSRKIIRGMYKTNVIFSIVKLVLLFIGVFSFGFWGVIGARVLYEYIGLALVWWYAATARESVQQ